MEKNIVEKILQLEKKRLDNKSVIGGFHSFLKDWLAENDFVLPKESLKHLNDYESLTEGEKKGLLFSLERLFLPREKGILVPEKKEEIFAPPTPISSENLLLPVRTIKGVGPAIEKKLERLLLSTREEVLWYFPRSYQDRGDRIPISRLRGQALETVQGKVVSHQYTLTRKGRLLKIVVADDTGSVTLVCFHRDFLARTLPPGTPVALTGWFTRSYGALQTSRFDYTIQGMEKPVSPERIFPIYGLTEGLTQKKIRQLISTVLDENLSQVPEILPETLRQKHGLCPRTESIRELHQPQRSVVSDLLNRRSRAHFSLIFEEFLLFALQVKTRRRELAKMKGIPVSPDSHLVQTFLPMLPFQLTAAQERVFRDIVGDLTRAIPMNRLIQGDVGSGKTILALLGALQVIDSGGQVAFMVPTEILASQHFRRWEEPLAQLGVTVGCLTGGMSRKKKALLEDIEKGNVQLAIGTHALLEEGVQFRNLGLVIVDEQHRFGVMQRARLREKGTFPHMLVMTATPIPRTLALTLYGDLDVSIVDQKPAGRKPVETLCFSEKEQYKAYNRVRAVLEKGGQGFVVCPAIEENEQELSTVQEICELLRTKWMTDFRVEMIHGQLSPAEKEAIMEQFSRGDIQVLVATSVIEVGIDVVNARVMVIENAERFGLAQLHQLRGRIGRGERVDLCILLARTFAEVARKRMEIMVSSQDGFRIAEEDLKLRGPGEFFGLRQHGIPEFRLADPLQDWPILEKAYQEAEYILRTDPELTREEHCWLQKEIERRLDRNHPSE